MQIEARLTDEDVDRIALRLKAILLPDLGNQPPAPPDPLISERRELSLRKLIRINSVKCDCAGCGRLESTEAVQQRALTASGWTHDRHSLSSLQRQRYVDENMQRTAGSRVFFRESGDFEQCENLCDLDFGFWILD